jgi:hypothetical protein
MTLTLTGCVLFLVCVVAGIAVVLPAVRPLRVQIVKLKARIDALPIDETTRNLARIQASLEGLERLSTRGKAIFKKS